MGQAYEDGGRAPGTLTPVAARYWSDIISGFVAMAINTDAIDFKQDNDALTD
jgi:hypothetical protein